MVREALMQAWPPFVLVTGLLLIGRVAHEDGLFAAAGAALERLPGPPSILFVYSGVLVVLVTAVLNLDTAVVFLTPVLILSARTRGVSEEGFLYLTVFMANAGSLFLPGSNLTNLLVLADHPRSGGQFADAFLAPALAAAFVTLLGLTCMFRGTLIPGPPPGSMASAPRGWRGPGALAALAAGVLTVLLRQPAVPVLILGLGAAGHARVRARLTTRQVVRAVSPLVLGGVFVLSVALGVLARNWDAPSTLIAGAGRWQTAGIGALASVAVNNLPAAVLLSAQSLPHPRALLIGLNLGPNLAVTGSLSAYLWFQAARQVQAVPSAWAYLRRGALLAPAAIAAALLVSGG